MRAYATINDIRLRHPAELVLLAADEITGQVDETRVDQALAGASADINGVLFARYTAADLARLDADSSEILRTYAVDIGLYRVALSFSRSSERLKEMRDAAMEALKAIARGTGGLTFEGAAAGGGPAGEPPGAVSPNQAIVIANERVMTRDRLRGW